MRRYLSILTSIALVTGAVSVQAMTASQTIQKEVVSVSDDGVETVSYESAELVTPGERVVYTVNFENNLDQPETNLVLTMPIPAEVTYLDGTATDGLGTLTFSADDGDNFADRSDLRIADERGELQPARAADVTHIRWVIAGPIAPGETGSISFKGILK